MAMRNRGTNWRKMAAEARTIADGMHDPDSKRVMLQIAEGYENLAAYAERPATNERTEGGGGPSEKKNLALERTVESRDGTLPVGAGTAVHVYPGGHAYDLEFNSPFHTWLRWEPTR